MGSGQRKSAGKGPAVPAGLSREVVLDAALGLLDAAGPDGFTMRALARRLGVYPTAIYWYFPRKNDLLAAVVAHVLRDLAPATDPRDWRQFVAELFRRYRDAMRRHPHVAALTGANLVSNAAVDLALIDGILAALAHAGCPDARLLAAFDVVISAMAGFATMEFAARPAEDRPAWVDGMRAAVDAVDPARHPHLHRLRDRMANRHFMLRWENGTTVPLDAGFDAHVAIVIAGLEAFMHQQEN
jgi:AcrR family transcriptional regulator